MITGMIQVTFLASVRRTKHSYSRSKKSSSGDFVTAKLSTNLSLQSWTKKIKSLSAQQRAMYPAPTTHSLRVLLFVSLKTL